MIIAYVAGPYRADTVAGIQRNIAKAREVAEALWGQGVPVICPHTNTAFMDGICNDQLFLDADLEIIKRAVDVVVLVDGWDKSSGTLAEIAFATEHNIPVLEFEKMKQQHNLTGMTFGETIANTVSRNTSNLSEKRNMRK